MLRVTASLDEGVEDADRGPVVLVAVEERLVFGGLLVEVVVGLVGENDVQADVPVTDVDGAGVRFDQRPGGEERDARMVLEVCIAVRDEPSPGGG